MMKGMDSNLLLALAAALAALSIVACSGDGNGGGDSGNVDNNTPSARPAALPDTAQHVTQQREFGALEEDASDNDVHVFVTSSCSDGLLTVETDKETIYAELPCDRALPQETVDMFAGTPVHVRLVPGDPAKIFLEAPDGASVEFTPGNIWVDEK